TTGRQLQYLQLVHCVLCTVHLKLPEDNCCCSAPINTTGRQLQYLQLLCAATSHCRLLVCQEGQQGVSRGNSAGLGDVASSSAHGHGTRLSFFLAAGRVEPQHAKDLIQWMTKPSSSSSSSLTQAQSTLSGIADANVASSLSSMASVTPSLAPPCPPEESPELFDHSVGYKLQEDA
ncbi:hypothetical protein AB205_0074780, partial [Aquarana catesbeiana]